ncbi:hypothetical protein [Lysobacter gummosus]
MQQSGSAGAGVVREKADPKTISPSREEKPYYSGAGRGSRARRRTA